MTASLDPRALLIYGFAGPQLVYFFSLTLTVVSATLPKVDDDARAAIKRRREYCALMREYLDIYRQYRHEIWGHVLENARDRARFARARGAALKLARTRADASSVR